ncbi:MAG: type II toxin-antitoxin system HicA family toxin [Chloroflexi bacterium]|nr:type II toxin-antitoxin system HicA family toxin [Chloroflexota bacterium]MYJ93209.1 type II toxin-antitoxin system HicA family toxin [Chloroflexota bacterium]
MNRHQRLLNRILDGRQLANIAFNDVRSLLIRMGFEERIRGSHHIYARAGIDDTINLQPQGSDAIPYQLRQLRAVLAKHNLRDASGGN